MTDSTRTVDTASPTRSAVMRRGATLRVALAEFLRHPTPWMIGAVALGAWVARFIVGGWSWRDPVVIGVLLAISPLIEWLIHVFILHWRPRRVGRVKVDTLLASKHRAHHRNPRDIPLIFIPWQVVVGLLPSVVLIGLFAFVGQLGEGLTFIAMVTTFLLGYEWTHYLIHTDYKPRHALYRAVWRNHRFHHFKNEHYWFTVTTSGTADRLLRTYPDPENVESSPTARNLHALG